MKWVREDKVWYSEDVIKKIKDIAYDIVKNDVYENSDAKAQTILELIEREG